VLGGLLQETAINMKTDEDGRNYIRVLTLHPTRCCVVGMKYYPRELEITSEDPVNFNVRISSIGDLLKAQVLPNDFDVRFRRFTGELQIEATFQKDAVLRYREIEALTQSQEEVPDKEFSSRYHVKVSWILCCVVLLFFCSSHF